MSCRVWVQRHTSKSAPATRWDSVRSRDSLSSINCTARSQTLFKRFLERLMEKDLYTGIYILFKFVIIYYYVYATPRIFCYKICQNLVWTNSRSQLSKAKWIFMCKQYGAWGGNKTILFHCIKLLCSYTSAISTWINFNRPIVITSIKTHLLGMKCPKPTHNQNVEKL